MTPSNCGTTEKGFTLVEVMVVMAIIAILAFFAAPAVENFGPNMRLKRASRDLHTTLGKMKTEAIKRNTNVLITLNPVACPPPPSGGSYSVDIDIDKSGTVNAGDESFTMFDDSGDATPDVDYDLPNNTALCINGSIPAATVFMFTSRGLWLDSAGNPLGGDTTIELRNDSGARYDVSVSLSGGIRTNKI